MDVVPDFAAPQPVGLIAEILGVPASDRHLFKHWVDALLGFQGVNKPSEADLSRAQSGLIEIRAYLIDMIGERRRHPWSDLMSKFVAAESDGERLSEAELINACVTLFVAGYETTVSLIGNTIYLLLSNPDQLRLLQQDPGWLSPALEESLRFESPVARQPRLMKTDAEFGGQKFLKGQMVFQMLNAANRDPAHFQDPDKFDIQRKKNRHIAFGNGIHFCVGAVLARAEAWVAVGALLERLPGLRFSKELAEWDLEKRNSRVLKALPVRY
jgi:cytochrome P450